MAGLGLGSLTVIERMVNYLQEIIPWGHLYLYIYISVNAKGTYVWHWILASFGQTGEYEHHLC